MVLVFVKMAIILIINTYVNNVSKIVRLVTHLIVALHVIHKCS